MEDIEKRLRESTDACIKNFEAWLKNNKNSEGRESLMESMHEVRKVIARLEIEIAINDRDRLGSRPIPIPPHRSSRKPQNAEEGMDGGDEDATFDAEPPRQESRRPHGQQGRGRRPMHGGGNRERNPGNESSGNTGPEGQS